MEQLGADTVLVCSNVSEHAIDDDALAAAQLRELAERAAARGIRIAYEALAWGRHVRDYDHAWRIVEAGDHPNLGTCLDSFHILSRGADPAGIRDIPGEKIFFLQVADAPHLVMDVLQWSRHYRCFPGQGGFDLPGFLGHVLAAGYEGPLSLEVFNDVFRQADPARMAVDAMRSLLVLEEAAEVSALPPVPALRGYAFAELAVAPEAAPRVERLLIAMGFRHAGQHRTKAVQLWRHGDDPHPRQPRAPGGPGPRVAAIAVESADPIASARRAERLLAPVLPRDRGPGEADLSAIAAPDGTSVFFCRTDAGDAESWVADFLTRRPARARRRRRAHRHRPRRAVAAVRLLRRGGAVLPLRARARARGGRRAGRARRARPQPRRAQRRRAACASRCACRWSATAAPSSSTSPSRAATSTPPPARCATAASRCSPSPATTTRTWPPGPGSNPASSSAMRELGILYDASGGGELLHFYTAMTGTSLFLEVLERRGGYDGYGAPNSPVMIAAQRRERIRP